MPEHRRAQRSLETVDIIHLLGLIMASLVLVFRWDVIDRAGWLLALDLGLMVLVFATALGPFATAPRSRAAVWRLLISVGLVVVLFSEMAALVPAVNARRYDQFFLEIDSRYLGFAPFRSLTFMVHPILSELVVIIYLTFYAIPMAFFVVLYRARMFEEIASANAAVVTGFYVSFLGNAAFPTVSPFRVMAPAEPLSGLLVFETLYGLVDRAEPHILSAFPSGHILVSAIVVLLCARWRAPALPWFIAWLLMLWFATLYLGYHYLVDTIAALPLALLSIGAAQTLRRRLHRPNP
jgi:hypothetical protein